MPRVSLISRNPRPAARMELAGRRMFRQINHFDSRRGRKISILWDLRANQRCSGSMSKHVAVLMGGWSAERDVSLRSGRACADALERKGYRVSRVDVGRDIASVLAPLK